jgi:hypothetical protein
MAKTTGIANRQRAAVAVEGVVAARPSSTADAETLTAPVATPA